MKPEELAVLVCDSQSLICEGIVAILSRQPGIAAVGAVTTFDDAITKIFATTPAVVVVGHNPPVLDAVNLTRVIVARQEETPGCPTVAPVLLFPPSFPRGTLLQAVRAGARGLMAKDDAAQRLGALIRSAASGSLTAVPPLDDLLLAEMVSAMEETSGRRSDARLTEMLSRRELEVLRFVARGLTNDEIARELGLGVATVKSHFYSVCRKLGLRDRVQAVILAYESGLIRPATA